MELVDADSESPTLISNVEVMLLLQKNLEERNNANGRRRNSNKRNKHLRHRDWVEEEVFNYLQTTPCVKLDPDRRLEFHSKLKGNKRMIMVRHGNTADTSTPQASADAADTQKQQQQEGLGAAASPTAAAAAAAAKKTGFGLTDAEAIQIMNMMPTQPVEIHLMVDELQSRMSEERQEEFLAFIQSFSTAAEEEEEGSDAASGEEADDEGMEQAEEEDEEMEENGKGRRKLKNGKPPAKVNVKKEVDDDQTGII